jgi:ketosteroid isomerase-like protein
MKTMRWRAFAILVTMLLLAPCMAPAQISGAGREADHAALRAMMANVTQAINNQDMARLAPYFTRGFVFTTVDQSVLTNTLAVKNYYDRMLRQKDSPVTRYKMAPKADIPTIFLDANIGYVYGTSADVYTLSANGRKVPMTCHWTATVVKENGAWKMAAVHTGVNVMNNPVIDTLAAAMRRNLLIAAGIGLLLGLIIGIVVAKRMGKNPGK